MPSRVNENLLSSGHSASNYTQSGDNIVDNHLSGIDSEINTIQSDITTLDSKVPLNKFDATADPTVNDDAGDGYTVGSQWHNTNNSTVWFCLDASAGAAAWEDVTSDGTPSVQVESFDTGDSDWSGAGPYTLTKSHSFSTKNLFIQLHNSSDELMDCDDSDPVITVTTSEVTVDTAAKFEGKLIITDASGGFRASRTPSVILSEIKTVDGPGSGLDADTVDGQHASSFAPAVHTHSIANVTGLQTALDAKAPLSSPAFVGSPVAPTVGSAADSSTKLATTAFVQAALSSSGATTWNAAVTHAIFVSEDGHDSNGDGSLSNPYATLTKAITDLTASIDTIYIHGTITETAEVDLTGVSNVSIVGVGKKQSIITNSTVGTTLNMYAASDLTKVLFKNLTIQNIVDDAASNALIVGAADGVSMTARFENVEFLARAFPIDITTHANGTANLTFENTTITWGEEPTTEPTSYRGIAANSHTGSGDIQFNGLTFTSLGPEDDLAKPVYGIENYSSGGEIAIRNLYGTFSATSTKTIYVVYDNSGLNTDGITISDSHFELDAPGISGNVGTLAIGIYGAKIINCHVKVNRLDGGTSPSYAIIDPNSGSYGFTGILQHTASGVATCHDVGVKLADSSSQNLTLGDFTAKLLIVPDAGNTVTINSESSALLCDINGLTTAGNVDATVEVSSVGSATTISDAQAVYLDSASGVYIRMKSLRARLLGLSADVDFSAGSVGVRYDGAQDMELTIEGPSSICAIVEDGAYDDVVTGSSYAMDRESGSGTLTFARPVGLVNYSGFSAGADTGVTATALGGTV